MAIALYISPLSFPLLTFFYVYISIIFRFFLSLEVPPWIQI